MKQPEEIAEKLELKLNDIFNIYPYGSRVYGTNTENSDYDFIIVYKSGLLPSGAFKDNAKSSKDRTIQGTCYSRGGFIDAINNYQLPAWEALSSTPVLNGFPFNNTKFDEKEMTKKVITQASNSFYQSFNNWNLRHHRGELDRIKKGIWHSIRIVKFGKQIKQHRRIVNFTDANEEFEWIMNMENFDPMITAPYRDTLIDELKK